MSQANEGVDALLMDGRIVHVRRVAEADTEALSALYSRASPQSRYFRFFTAGISIHREVQCLFASGNDHVALVAEHDGVAVDVGSYEILNGAQAEIALLVDDAWQGHGIGSVLIEHLTALARRAGIQELVGDVLANNATMLRTMLPEDAIRALGHACRYARWRRQAAGNQLAIPGIDRQAAHHIVAAALHNGAGWQPVAVTHSLMTCYGIPLLETRLAASAVSAANMARELGFPIVM